MNRKHYVRALCRDDTIGTQYPRPSIVMAMVLIYLAPFVSSLLAYCAFVICVYRVVRYDARVFATDYCLLFPVARLFSTSGGFTLLVWLCLFASVWYVIRRGIRADATYVFLICMLNYLMFRMQLQIGAFVLCIGNLFMLCVLLPLQDEQSTERAAKLFCIGLIVSSVYAFVLRDTWQIRVKAGAESEAIWSSGIMRFSGLLPDPNFFMTMIVMGLTLLIKLKDCSRLSSWQFWVMGVILTLFGVLTYSKTFLMVFILLGGIYILWQLWNKKIISGTVSLMIALIVGSFLLFSEASPFAVVMERIGTARNLNELTTGRWGVYTAYWRAITEDVVTFFFGRGLAAKGLQYDPHNIFLEIMYYLGATGLVLFVGFLLSMVQVLKQYNPKVREQNIIAKYAALLLVLILFMSLNGVFQAFVYGDIFLAFISLLIVKKKTVSSETLKKMEN